MELPTVTSLLLLLLAAAQAQYDAGGFDDYDDEENAIVDPEDPYEDPYIDYVDYGDYEEGTGSGSGESSEELIPEFPTDPAPSVNPEDYPIDEYKTDYPAQQNINLDELNAAVENLGDLMDNWSNSAANHAAAQNEGNNALAMELGRLGEVVTKLELTWSEMAAKGDKLKTILDNMEAKFEETVEKLEQMESKASVPSKPAKKPEDKPESPRPPVPVDTKPVTRQPVATVAPVEKTPNGRRECTKKCPKGKPGRRCRIKCKRLHPK